MDLRNVKTDKRQKEGYFMAQRLPILYNKKTCYDIVFSHSFEDLSQELQDLGVENRKICIYTDSNVEKLYAKQMQELLEPICRKVILFSFPAGEEHKTLDTIKEAYKTLIEAGFDRKDLILALGGGVVGDMAGYTAATYLRGIDFVQVPTTLLAQCDSSIGGKTGVDFDGYKNMVGAFHMPRLVYMNLATLKTLDDRQFYNGFAEVMKHGLIKDAVFYEWLIEKMYEICERDLDTLEEMIMRSCTVKKLVVEKDPTEQGDRALLNFGHTIGHAIEKYKNFTLSHGECVALGCVAAAFISWKHELLTMEEYYEIRDMFVPFNLPISVEDIDPQEVLQLTKSDKKMKDGTLQFILLKRVGKAMRDTSVTDADILAALDELIFKDED
jgi:3-dehydroquinate synthase